MIERDRMVLPEPDSPTMPRALPRSRVKLTPSTARTTPRGVLKWVVTSLSSRRGPSMSRADAWICVLIHQPPGCRSDGASRSPMRLNERTVRNSIRQGNIVAHQASSILLRFSSISLPQVGVPTSTPRPRKASAPSAAIRMPRPVNGDRQHRRDQVGQDLAEHHAAGLGAEAAGGEHELPFAQRQRLGPHDAGERRDGEDAEGEHDLPLAARASRATSVSCL